MALTQAAPIWLDVTRLLSRVGRGVLTGIDRVELAYLDRFLAEDDGTTRFLCRSTRGVLLLGAPGAKLLAALAKGEHDLGKVDRLSWILGKVHNPRHRAEAMLRPHAVDRCILRGLRKMIDRADPVQTYVNVGHANLSERILPLFRNAGANVVVMVHDLIPLTHPDTVVPGLPERFAARLERVRRYAGLVICNSNSTCQELSAYWAQAESAPEITVAPLGVAPAPAISVQKDPRSFVMLGTIEARKNHALMLEVWDILAKRRAENEMPHLHIIGPRGWRVEKLLKRLDTHPLQGKAIFEHGPLPEAETRRFVASASALLFPSIAEGFGYPPLEALALGTRPIVSDLPALRETLDKHAFFLPVDNAYCWAETIEQRLGGSLDVPDGQRIHLPTWQTHFGLLANALAQIGTGKDA